jgi:hypothetical protein
VYGWSFRLIRYKSDGFTEKIQFFGIFLALLTDAVVMYRYPLQKKLSLLPEKIGMGKTMKRTNRVKDIEERFGGTTVEILDRLMRELVRARNASRDALRRVRSESSDQALQDFLKARQDVLLQRQRLLRVLEAHTEG